MSKQMLLRKTLVALVAIALGAGMVVPPGPAHAVSNPILIQWRTPDARSFIVSLYQGVLGRNPESEAVVRSWMTQITSNPRSRLAVFNGFLSSPEYRRRFGAGGQYHFWVNNCPRTPNNRFAVSVMPPAGSWSAQHNRISLGHGRALIGYYSAFWPYRRC